MSPEEIAGQKNVEFYSAGVNAWYNTSLEYDKSILALSAGGVGLLVTLLTAVGVQSKWLLGLYATAIACFLTSIVVLLLIFTRNKKHLEAVLVDGQVAADPVLKTFDRVAFVAFAFGAFFAAIVGITSAFHSYESEQKKMAIEKPRFTSPPQLLEKSFNGVGRMQNSFNGIGRVQPQSVGGTPAPTPAAVPTPTPTPTPGGSTGGSSGR